MRALGGLRCLICGHSPARLLLCRVKRFVRQHSVLGAPAATPFLASDLFDTSLLSRHRPCLQSFDFVQQQTASDESVQSLLARRLAFNLQARWAMQQNHAGGALVYVLASMPAGADKCLLDIAFRHAQSG